MTDCDPRTWHSIPGTREHHRVFGTECECEPVVTPMPTDTGSLYIIVEHNRR